MQVSTQPRYKPMFTDARHAPANTEWITGHYTQVGAVPKPVIRPPPKDHTLRNMAAAIVPIAFGYGGYKAMHSWVGAPLGLTAGVIAVTAAQHDDGQAIGGKWLPVMLIVPAVWAVSAVLRLGYTLTKGSK